MHDDERQGAQEQIRNIENTLILTQRTPSALGWGCAPRNKGTGVEPQQVESTLPPRQYSAPTTPK
jgi:hypothetical protein